MYFCWWKHTPRAAAFIKLIPARCPLCISLLSVCLLIHPTPKLCSYSSNASSLRSFTNQLSPLSEGNLWNGLNIKGFHSKCRSIVGRFCEHVELFSFLPTIDNKLLFALSGKKKKTVISLLPFERRIWLKSTKINK